MHIYLFCFKQKTAYEMRISDWSSDVCSSDLAQACVAGKAHHANHAFAQGWLVAQVGGAVDHLAGDADLGQRRQLGAPVVELAPVVEHVVPAQLGEPALTVAAFPPPRQLLARLEKDGRTPGYPRARGARSAVRGDGQDAAPQARGRAGTARERQTGEGK